MAIHDVGCIWGPESFQKLREIFRSKWLFKGSIGIVRGRKPGAASEAQNTGSTLYVLREERVKGMHEAGLAGRDWTMAGTKGPLGMLSG